MKHSRNNRSLKTFTSAVLAVLCVCVVGWISTLGNHANATGEADQAGGRPDSRTPAPPEKRSASSVAAATLARGEYLAKAADCAGCHTAAGGGAPYAGGLGLASPFGTIQSSNITPDPRYGIGLYTYDDFEHALRKGVARGGKRLYPAMPYTSFSKLSDDDVHALYAFMMHGVPAVPKPTPPSDVTFPFNQRWALRFWQMAFAPRDPFSPKTDHDAQWNQGAYLVQGAGHCGACHTPRGSAFEESGYDESSRDYLTGGVNDHWFAPNLTGDAGSGLGRMSEGDIAAFLKTGHGAGAIAYGSMVEHIEDSSQYLSDEDLEAIAHYLKSLPAQRPSGTYTPGSDAARSSANGNRIADSLPVGFYVYRSFCASCHRDDGSGVTHAFPTLAGNPSVLTEDTTSLIRLLVEGGNSPSTLTGPPRQAMPGFATTLTDVEIALVLTYIRSAWGNHAQPVTANDVATLRKEIHK
ncbi:cytochrome c, mono- and diheme variants family [Burkholderia sp. Ch1-1]|uniref:Alcohol dehydrogenase (Quinone), cytochrome c subunit n=1 Tax=Paraburkholderia dioscoreae TaxID=2604047 RepID=A0A5Q4ZGU5_9BURK|nr:cytochrome c, mono- and diheme variants family [Burkholderia sp. Ch1-1]VVD28984.1 Alcohol dehydrogenase (quinone), cytochrome c subunit [Paraburkholderia dioscoreae]